MITMLIVTPTMFLQRIIARIVNKWIERVIKETCPHSRR
jgi:hypothetical protein